MPLISIDPSNLAAILLVRIFYQPRMETASRLDFRWRLLPWVLIQGLLVLVLAFRAMKTFHDSRTHSDLLQRILAKEEDTVDIAVLLVTGTVVGWVGIQSFRDDDIELQDLEGHDDAPRPGHELVELAVQDEEAWFGGELDVEAGGELRDLEGVGDFVVDMPGAFPA